MVEFEELKVKCDRTTDGAGEGLRVEESIGNAEGKVEGAMAG
jgi:hypothetical protein